MIGLYVCWYYSSLVFFLWSLNHISFGVSRVRYRCALSVIFRVCDVWMDSMLLWTLFLFQVPWFALFHIVCNNYHCAFLECTSASSSSLFSPTSEPRRAPFLVRPFPFLSPFLTSFLHLHKGYIAIFIE
jgi:hypothetical protein